MGATESTRGIRTLPVEGANLTSAEEDWVTTEAAAGNFQVDTFTGDGSTTAFTLTQTYSASVIAAEGGRVLDEGDDYTASGTTLTITYAPPDGSRILIVYRY